MATVDLTDQRAEFSVHLAVFRHLDTALRRHLQERHLAPPRGIGVEKVIERLQSMGDTLRIVKAIDADDQTPASETDAQLFGRRRSRRLARRPGINPGSDRNRKRTDLYASSAELERGSIAPGGTTLMLEVAPEIIGVMLGLHPDEIVVAQCPEGLGVLRQGQQNVRWRARDVQ